MFYWGVRSFNLFNKVDSFDDSTSESSNDSDTTDAQDLDLPPHACSYCGIDPPASLVKCLICSRWFCNPRENTSASHIANHLLRAKHKEIILRPERSPDESNPECYKCGNKNVFMLGLTSIADKSVVLLCCQPCSPIFRDIPSNSSNCAPLIKEPSFLTWLIASPNETKQLFSCQISFTRMDDLEDLWRDSQSNEAPATPTLELRHQREPLREDNSSDMVALVRNAYVEGQKALQTQLDQARAELRDVRTTNKHLTNKYQQSISQLEAELGEVTHKQNLSLVQYRSLYAEHQRLTNENLFHQQSISQLKMKLSEAKAQNLSLVQFKQVQAENKRLTDENQSQQLKATVDEVQLAQDYSLGQTKSQLHDATASLIDSMQHKLISAERQLRCLDHLTRFKLESRQEHAYGLPKRGRPLTSMSASAAIISRMHALNHDMCQACLYLANQGLHRRSEYSNSHKLQAQKVLGNHLTAMMEDQAIKITPAYDVLLMQSVLLVFMVHWCSAIIEAFYPKQESFSDLLVQLSAQTLRTSGSAAVCGKQIQIVQPATAYTDNLKFKKWVQDITEELESFLRIAGMGMETQLFSAEILVLVEMAYELRTAMAEKDICGGLEIVIVAPDTPFQEKWMTDALPDPRKDQSHRDFVAGTIGIGLQRRGHFESRMVTELKPRVILAERKGESTTQVTAVR